MDMPTTETNTVQLQQDYMRALRVVRISDQKTTPHTNYAGIPQNNIQVRVA